MAIIQFETDFENALALRDPSAPLSRYLAPYIQPFDNAYSYHQYCQISDEAGRQLGHSPWDIFQKRTMDFAHAKMIRQ